MKTLNKFSLIGLASVMVSPAVFAEKFEPAPVDISGSLKLVPTVEFGLEYDDNIYSEERDPTGSGIYVVEPDFALGTDDGVNRYGVRYKLKSGTVEASSADNYLDHRLSGLAHIEPNDKNRIDVNLAYDKLHEDRGTGLSEGRPGAIDRPVEYDAKSANAAYQYGALSSKARVGGSVGFYSKEYTNFRQYSAIRDFDQNSVGLNFEYSIGDATSLTLDGSTADIRYPHIGTEEPSRDSTDNRALIGLKWDITGKTTGKAKVGYQVKDFDAAERKDFSGAAVDVSLSWEPRTYSTIDFKLGQVSKDPTTVGDYIEERYVLIGWNHGWTPRISTDVQASYADEEYVGNLDRHDDTTGATLALNYAFARWLTAGLSYDYTNKDSNVDDIPFDKNVYKLMVTAGL
ncbi:outer membrane beta-barrel protein [Agaribacterium haliotis]|uniref:outer membrane beta-barrel protein n=1 Tax=Agaribacterium haliotis TaxID=2013869 RepID=UPI000BB564E4|nr:outer membrane beta-barrel protein [Agaribacterium haliotis]